MSLSICVVSLCRVFGLALTLAHALKSSRALLSTLSYDNNSNSSSSGGGCDTRTKQNVNFVFEFRGWAFKDFLSTECFRMLEQQQCPFKRVCVSNNVAFNNKKVKIEKQFNFKDFLKA